MELNDLRNKLDKIDNQLIKILAKRMALIPSVAEYKIKNNLPRYQPEREKQVLKKIKNLANKANLNPNLAKNIIKLIIADAHRIEKDLMRK